MSTEAAAVEWLCPPDAYQHECGVRGAPPLGGPAHRHDERCRPGPDMTKSLVARIAVLEKANAALTLALRKMAEGNLGDRPWQAGYGEIRYVAAEALKDAAFALEAK